MIQLEKVTIGQFVDYCKLIDTLKPKLEQQFGNLHEVSAIDIFVKCPEYVQEIVKFWTGWETVKDKDMDLVLGIFATIEKLSVIPEPVAISTFEHEGYTYAAPEDVQLLNKAVPMGKATFGQALEAMQIEQLMNGDYEMIPHVLGVIFLREGETIDGISLSERAELMRRVPITTAMNAYFFWPVSPAHG